MIIEDVLCPLPKYDLFAHYFLAVVAQVFQGRLVAPARLSRDWFCFWVPDTVVFKFDTDVKAVHGESIEVFVSVLRANLPPIDLNQVIVPYEGRVEGDSEDLRVARDFALVLEDNHDVSEQDDWLADDGQVDFYVFVAVVSPDLI